VLKLTIVKELYALIHNGKMDLIVLIALINVTLVLIIKPVEHVLIILEIIPLPVIVFKGIIIYKIKKIAKNVKILAKLVKMDKLVNLAKKNGI